MSDQSDRLRRMFESDSRIMMESLTRLLASQSAGEIAPASVDRAFRAAHSIKTEAGFLSIDGVTRAAHRLEEALSRVRERGGMVGVETATELRRALAALQEELDAYQMHESGPPETPTAAEPPRTPGAAAPRPTALRAIVREARARGERAYRLRLRITTAEQLRYARAFLVVNNLELVSAVVALEPELEEFARGSTDLLTVLLTASGDEQKLRSAVTVDEVEVVDLSPLAYEELSVEKDSAVPAALAGPQAVAVTLDDRQREQVAFISDEANRLARALSRGSERGTEVSEGLDRLVRLTRLLRDRLEYTSRVQLLDTARELRRPSVAYGASQGKRVRIELAGDGALVGAGVADAVGQALLHLIRNSIEHGIEAIGPRVRRGKPPAGTISVRIERVAEMVRVIVRDDGTGVDERRARSLAGDSAEPLLEVLARPGLTTRGPSDGGSGRGVGLDVVVHTVRDLLCGEVELRNHPGEGLEIEFRVSATVGLIPVIVVAGADGPVAVPRIFVAAREPLDRRRVRRDSLGGLYYDIDGEILTLRDAGGAATGVQQLSGSPQVLVVGSGAKRRTLLYARLIGEEPVARDERNHLHVYSRLIGRTIPLVNTAGDP